MDKARITTIGAGSWGSALSRIASDNGYPVMLYDVDQDTVNEINTFHTNRAKLKNGRLSPLAQATTDLAQALDFGEIILLVVPTAVMRTVVKQIAALIKTPKLFVNASKGIEPETFSRVSEIVKSEIDARYIKGFVALTGPSHAEEVILQMLTVVDAASERLEDAQLVQRVFSNQQNFRVYTTTDLVGAELCGSLKNVIALASGIIAGLGYGVNTRAALITRGLVDMKRIVIAMGGKEETLYGLAGLGDLVVTATSTLSRNFTAGYKIGSGETLKKALSEMTQVVEGARSAVAAHEIIISYHLYCPIMETVYEVVYDGKDPHQAIDDLMAGELKSEI